ncbi:PepSY-associated TM helix domain-containing protein [Paraburkholderia tropica]|uniref:PepSY-associated TM helix domain-containing protein n=1 Tax=Paraburkholderia tropica TaxID=92647 RepID=UPI002AB6456B|nr:PepSY-associated TM helix domain-containing protein [Paraburkholderia tropica]
MRGLLHFAHLWIGIVLGAYFALLGLTGSTLVFKSEIERALAPDLYKVATPTSATPTTRFPLDTLIADFQRNHAGVTNFSIQLPQSLDDSMIINYIPATPPDWHGRVINPYSPVAPPVAQGRHDRHELFIDPYTGKALGEHLVGGTFFYVVHNLHAHLLLEDIGYTFHTYAVLFLLVLVASGLWLWWPSVGHFRKQFKARTRIKFGASIKRIVVDLHNTIGFYVFVVLFSIVTTATLHLWPGPARWLFLSVNDKLHDSLRAIPATSTITAQRGQAFSTLPYSRAVELARSVEPSRVPVRVDIDSGITTVMLGSLPDHLVSPRLTSVSLRATGPATIQVQSPASVPLDSRIDSWIMFVHYGQWGPGGAFYFIKAIWLIAGLSPTVLFVSGCTMYLNKHAARRKAERSRSRRPVEDRLV